MGADKVLFSRMDCYNVIGRQREKYIESKDTQTLMEYLKNKQVEDPTFFSFYRYTDLIGILCKHALKVFNVMFSFCHLNIY